jgi:hypothetical protein
MQLKLFSICEGAFNNGGRLTIVNTYDVIHSKAFPLVMAIGVAMTIAFDPEDEGKHSIEMRIENNTTKMEVAKMVSDVIVPRDEEGGFLNFTSNVAGFNFKEPAKYAFNLFVDGNPLGSIIIPVKKVE